jgi:hypothetical protein
MSKVICAAVECKYNKNSICKAKQINLTAGNIATVHEGRQDMWRCKMYELSEFAKKVDKFLKECEQG